MSVIEELAAVCGADHVRQAAPIDVVGGVPARWVASPADAGQVGAVLRIAGDHELAVVATGSGTKLDWGGPPSHVDIVLETNRLAGVRLTAEDSVATIGAGTPLRAVHAALARTGRRLALDPGSPGASIGGVLATNESGPLRLTRGTPRDQVVAMRFVRADGTLSDAGVGADRDPNGYDLSKILCGSYGTLGVITEATVRLESKPESRAWVLRPVRTPLEVSELVGALRRSPLDAEAIEVDLPAAMARPGPLGELAVLLEGGVDRVAEQAASVGRQLGGTGVTVVDTPPEWWGRYPFGADDLGLEIHAPVDGLHAALYALRDAAGAPVPVRGSVGSGIVHVALSARIEPERLGNVMTAIRTTLHARNGRCELLRGPQRLRALVHSGGPARELSMARQVKERFDPHRRLSPGRLPGGR